MSTSVDNVVNIYSMIFYALLGYILLWIIPYTTSHGWEIFLFCTQIGKFFSADMFRRSAKFQELLLDGSDLIP